MVSKKPRMAAARNSRTPAIVAGQRDIGWRKQASTSWNALRGQQAQLRRLIAQKALISDAPESALLDMQAQVTELQRLLGFGGRIPGVLPTAGTNCESRPCRNRGSLRAAP
jgi:hypothetical protein